MKISDLNNEYYTWEQIEAVAKFQLDGGAYTDHEYTRLLFDTGIWPTQFTSFAGPVYRAMALRNDLFDDMIAGKTIKSKFPTSWSMDFTIVKDFVEENKFIEPDALHNGTAVIFKVISPKNVLNIYALHKSNKFKNSVRHYENNGRYFNEGLEILHDEKEVIIENIDYTIDMAIMYGWTESTKMWVRP